MIVLSTRVDCRNTMRDVVSEISPATSPRPTSVGRPPLDSAVAYVRVSSEEQARNGVSLDAQRARIVAYAEAKSLKVQTVFDDEGISGKDLDRPGLRQLLETCRRGLVANVVVFKLDRLSRRTRHLLDLVEELFLARGVELHSVSESLDTATPHGRFVLTLLGGLAQMERELIAERTRGALAWKRANGFPTSHAPLGFRPTGRRVRMEVVPGELRVVRRILTLWEAGRSFRAIAAELNAEGIPTKCGARWHHTTIGNVVAARDRYESVLGSGMWPLSVDTSERACPPTDERAGGRPGEPEGVERGANGKEQPADLIPQQRVARLRATETPLPPPSFLSGECRGHQTPDYPDRTTAQHVSPITQSYFASGAVVALTGLAQPELRRASGKSISQGL